MPLPAWQKFCYAKSNQRDTSFFELPAIIALSLAVLDALGFLSRKKGRYKIVIQLA
jgi:hypothetical protein